MSSENNEPKVWTFYSTGEAYGAVQCRDEIRDGDVLVIEREQVIGIAHTWPFALTQEHGSLHTLKEHVDPRTWEDGKYASGVALAEREAARLNLPLPRAGGTAAAPANESKRD
ncbi:hypothetical protein [Streptomyces rimosus]|uniref:hypothetical protein n=1 Tax=Streptomyces rimosus TaxID=1927 RepID=UPI00067A7D90|nr:hypothetical protein [Streptomyces rimosus]